MNARKTPPDVAAECSADLRGTPSSNQGLLCLELSGEEADLVARAASLAGTPAALWARWVVVSASRRRIDEAASNGAPSPANG